MSKNYYISDLHLGHGNVIRFDGRPFGEALGAAVYGQ